MSGPTVDLWVAGAAIVTLVLLPTVSFLLKREIMRLEKDIDGIQRSREEIRRDLEKATDEVERKLNNFEKEVAKEYVSFDRLTAAMKPVVDRLGEIERTQERIFDRLDAKADKVRHRDG